MAISDSDVTYKHFLQSGATITEVVEPRGFKPFQSEIDRDLKAHGMFYRFTSGTLKLGFVGPGRTILEDAYQAQGVDAIVYYLVDRYKGAFIDRRVFVGTAIFSNRTLDKDYFEVDFVDDDFIEKIRNRLDIPIKLDATEDLDGNPITQEIVSQASAWNGQRTAADDVNYEHTAGADPADIQAYNSTGETDTDADLTRWTIPNYTGLVSGSLTTKETVIEQTWGNAKAPHTNNFWTIDANGSITFQPTPHKFQLSGVVYSTAVTPILVVSYSWVLEHYNSAGVLQNTYDNTTPGLSDWGGSISSLDDSDPFDFGLKSTALSPITFDVTATDKLTWNIKLRAQELNSGNVTVDIDLDLYEISGFNLTLTAAETAYWVVHYLVYDVINFLVQALTGRANAVRSEWLKLVIQGAPSDGCGGLKTITSGFHIRGQSQVPEISLGEVLTALKVIDNVGYGVENNYWDNEFVLRVEPMEYFYADTEVLNLGQVDDFVSEVNADMLVNQIEIGYDKFAEGNDDPTSNDANDFLTRSTYATPLLKAKNKVALLSPLIASGWIIQSGFENRATPTKTWRHDSDNFIVVVRNDGSGFIVPENEENIDVGHTAGLDDATTVYNARIAPVYCFLNHALWFNSMMLGKSIDREYTNQRTVINKDFATRVKTACQDPEKQTRSAAGNVKIRDNNYGLRLFNPHIHTFQLALTKDQVETLIEKLTGNGTSNNYGYLTYLTERGETEQGYPVNIKYSPSNEIAEFQCFERSDNYLSE